MHDLWSPSILIWFIPAAALAVLFLCALCYLMREDILRLIKKFMLSDTKTYSLNKGIISNITPKNKPAAQPQEIKPEPVLEEDGPSEEETFEKKLEEELVPYDAQNDNLPPIENLKPKTIQCAQPRQQSGKKGEKTKEDASEKDKPEAASAGAEIKEDKADKQIPQKKTPKKEGSKELPVISIGEAAKFAQSSEGKRKPAEIPDRLVFCALILILFWLVIGLFAKVNLLSSLVKMERAKTLALEQQISVLKAPPAKISRQK